MGEAEELQTEEESVAALLGACKQVMELAHYGSIWYRLAGWAGHRGPQLEQEALARSKEIVGLVVNSTPRFQQAWREVYDREERESRALPFMRKVLLSPCTRSVS